MEQKHYKIGFAMYWLFFAALAFFAAQNPGYVRHPELVDLPWTGLFFTWAILAALIAGFYLVLKPALIGSSPTRLAVALALSLAMVVASIFTMVTDMPGLYYVPQYFSLLTFLVLLVVSASRAGRYLWRKAAGAP